MDEEQAVPATAGGVGPLPPYAQLPNFLAEDDRERLLEWAIAQEPQFKPAKVFHGEGGQEAGLRPAVRTALKLSKLGSFEAVLRSRLLEELPRIMAAAGYRGPEPRSVEFELNAYGDGAHFAPHIDIPLGQGRKSVGARPGEDRVISAVYYFHREPKQFSGGQLRLFRLGADESDAAPGDTVLLETVQNSLVVFPSWVRHGVEKVHCPTDRFEDFRFALNCWFCRRLDD